MATGPGQDMRQPMTRKLKLHPAGRTPHAVVPCMSQARHRKQWGCCVMWVQGVMTKEERPRVEGIPVYVQEYVRGGEGEYRHENNSARWNNASETTVVSPRTNLKSEGPLAAERIAILE